MNKLEKKITDLLSHMKNEYNASGIKAEFEAEGTRLEEAMRLKDVCSAAGLALNIKIGGCEALKDMFDAISLGAERIIAPMVETPYALKKFIRAAKIVYGENLDAVELLINIETETAYQNFQQMLKIEEIAYLKGVVIGRVDLAGSLNLDRDAINSQIILNKSLHISQLAHTAGLDVIVGGGVSADSLPFFKSFPQGQLTRFETRKVVFQCPAAIQNPEAAFLHAVHVELLWLKNKQNYYNAIAKEDHDRIQMLEKRYQNAIAKA